MPRNLVLAFDGTNNQFGLENTNVVRLVQALDHNPATERIYYDPGVGTLPEPGVWSRVGQFVSKVFGLAFGGGIFWKVGEAYQYLMAEWQPGDRVYLFGFSRGAYTARLVAAVLHHLGLLAAGNDNLVPYALRLFKAVPVHSGDGGLDPYFELGNLFRETFSRDVPGRADRRFPIHFLGLWDTVSSVGWVWDPPSYPFTARNPSVDSIRHAISIDERRCFFRQNRMRRARADQILEEAWFPGVHSDVGGGYPAADGNLWLTPFEWILSGARDRGLLFDAARLRGVIGQSPTSPCLDRQHESLRGLWWPAEFFPKMPYSSAKQRRLLALGLGRHRTIMAGESIHRCALERLRDKAEYRPPNISQAFVDTLRRVDPLPETLAYDPHPNLPDGGISRQRA